MVRDFIHDLTNNDDLTLIIMRGVLPILIIILAVLIRRMVPSIVRRIMIALGRLIKLSGADDVKVRDYVVDVAVPPLRLFVTISALWLIVALYEVSDNLQGYVDTIYTTFALIAMFWAINRAVDRAFLVWYNRARVHTAREAAFNETIVQFLERLAEAAIIVFAFVVIMDQWGVNLTALLAGLGLGGLAVALAAQDTISNLIGYFSIIFDRPFEVGDFIISSDYEGIVEEIGFRTTRVRRPDRALIYIPNNTLANDIVTNWSQSMYGARRGRVRLQTTLGVTYDTTADQMEALVASLHEHISNLELVVPGSVVVNFVEFGASSLDILIVVLVRVTGWEQVQAARQDINLLIMRLLAAHKLEVAFPTRTVILEQLDS